MEISSFLHEMRKEKADKMKSVLYFFNNADEIQKGIASELSYNEEFSKIDKKGSQIKDKLVNYKQEVISKISDCSVKVGELKAKIGEEPEKIEDGEGRPKEIYRHSQMYKEGEDVFKESKMLFNNLSYKICDLKKELSLTDTLIANIKEDKMYKLPVRVASMLNL